MGASRRLTLPLMAAVMALLSAVTVMARTGMSAAAGTWLYEEVGYRVTVSVSAGAVARTNRMVDMPANFVALLSGVGAPGSGFDPVTLRVREVDAAGEAIGGLLPSQWEPAQFDPANPTADLNVGRLIFPLTGTTAAGVTRRYHVYFDRPGTAAERLSYDIVVGEPVPRLVDVDEDLGLGRQELVVGQQGTRWVMDQQGGALSSLLDGGGRDWLSFNSVAGSASGGEFRGMPNVFPNPDGPFHPGSTGATTLPIGSGPLRTALRMTSLDGSWQWEAVFYPDVMVATVTKAPASWWWLYEGTPGGELGGEDLVLRPGADPQPATAFLGGDLGADLGFEWTAFADTALGRSLYLVQHQDDSEPDEYRSQDDTPNDPGGDMTVFGFGRAGLSASLTGPRAFTIGFADTTDGTGVLAAARSASQPLTFAIGVAESRSGGGVTTTTTLPPTSTTTTTPTPPGSGLGYEPVGPLRLLDTRFDGGRSNPFVGFEERSFQVGGASGLPADIGAVALTLSVTETGGEGYLRAWASGRPEPGASNLNWLRAGATQSNLAIVPVGADGRIHVRHAGVSAQVFADVVGVFRNGAAGRFHPSDPVRLVDSRDPGGTPIAAGTQVTVQTAARTQVAPGRMAAAVVNVTATGGTAPITYLAAHPGPGLPAGTSNLNPTRLETIPTAVIVPVQADGSFRLFNAEGSIDVVVDFVGWFDGGGEAEGTRFHPVDPSRMLDTRVPEPGTRLTAGQTIVTTLAGVAPIPAAAKAAAINVTVDQAASDGFIAVQPAGNAPAGSTQNLAFGLTRANLVLSKLNGSGQVSVFNATGSTHVVYDVSGWFG